MVLKVGRIRRRLLAPLAHRKEETQADLVVMRARDALVKARTMLINSVRSQVKSIGGRLQGATFRAAALGGAISHPHTFFFGRPLPRFTCTPVLWAARVVLAEPLPPSAG